MSVFALVHGAWHGGWAWERLAPELEARGHRTVAPDLPCDDPEAGAAEYADAVIEALGDADDVVLVGHSLAGLSVPLVATRRAISRLVLIAALVPVPGSSIADVLPRGVVAPEGRRRDERKRSSWTDADAARRLLYHDVDPERAAAAYARLRPQALKPDVETTPLGRWPDVPTDYIVCADDRMVALDWQRRTAAQFNARVLAGGHSPMLARPAQLAALLCP